MIKIMSDYKFKIGDTVWYFDNWGTLRNGVIYKIDGEYAGTKEGKFGGVQAGAKLEDCWPSKEACLNAENRRYTAQKEEYKKSIKSLEDLVRFLYDHDIHSENPDTAARTAAEECAADFGIVLEQ